MTSAQKFFSAGAVSIFVGAPFITLGWFDLAGGLFGIGVVLICIAIGKS